MTTLLSLPSPTPSTPAEEALDRALDALVLGDDRALERLDRLDPDLRSTVEEIYVLADLGGFAKETRHARTSRHPTNPRRISWASARWTRATTLIAAAVLLFATLGVSVLMAVQEDRRDPQPIMIAASDADPTAESTRELIDLPASTQPLTVATGETLGYGGMAAGATSVFRLLATPEFTGIEAVDAETETVAWRLATAWSSAGIYAGASGVYVVTTPNLLLAIDPATGSDLWQHSFGGPVVSMALQDANLRDDVLYVWDESSTMTAIDTATGDPLWQTTTADPEGPPGSTAGQTTPGIALAIGADVVVMVAANGTLNAFDRTTGEIAWSKPGFDGVDTRIVINFGYLMVISASADATDGPRDLIGTGIDIQTGDVKWQLGVSGPLLRPAAAEETFFYIVADHVVYLPDRREVTPLHVNFGECCADWTGSEDRDTSSDRGAEGGAHIFGIDTRSGEVIWSRGARAGSFINLKTFFPQSGNLLAVTSDGQFVSPASESGDLYAGPIDLEGQVIDIIPIEDEIVQYIAVRSDGTVFTLRRTGPTG